MPTRLLFVPALFLSAATLAAQTPAPTPVNLYVADLKIGNSSVSVVNPKKLTGDRGVSSQPSFTPDGKAILFVSRRDTTGQSDIYRIDLASGAETQVTATPENENTPTVTPDGGLMVIRWTPATLFKEWGPWIYDRQGIPVKGVLPGPDTVGYYVRVDSITFAMMRPKSRAAVALFDTRKATMTDYDWPVANLPPQLVPDRRAITYTRTDSLGHNQIRQLDLASLRTSPIEYTIPGRTVHAWTRNRFILMGKGNSIYALNSGHKHGWKKVAAFTDPELQAITTYVVSPDGRKVILISPVKPSLQQALRDSVLARRSLSDVIAVYRAGGTRETSMYEVSEAGLLGVASERVERGSVTDGIALINYTAELFPKSYAVPMTLGQALRKSGDVTGALTAYRRSLALNPRATAADQAAAVAAGKAIAELSIH